MINSLEMGIQQNDASTNTNNCLQNKPKIKKVRCAVCRKKLGLLGFDCKCSSTLKFCAEHRLPEKHACQFDHKSHQICNLADKLIKVNGEKIIRI